MGLMFYHYKNFAYSTFQSMHVYTFLNLNIFKYLQEVFVILQVIVLCK